MNFRLFWFNSILYTNNLTFPLKLVLYGFNHKKRLTDISVYCPWRKVIGRIYPSAVVTETIINISLFCVGYSKNDSTLLYNVLWPGNKSQNYASGWLGRGVVKIKRFLINCYFKKCYSRFFSWLSCSQLIGSQLYI